MRLAILEHPTVKIFIIEFFISSAGHDPTFEPANIFFPIDPEIYPLASDAVISEVSNIDISVFIDKFTLAVFFSIDKFSGVLAGGKTGLAFGKFSGNIAFD